MAGPNTYDDPPPKAVDNDQLRADLREAYERGRADERATRKRHPIGMTLTFIVAAIGLVLIALAAVNGSFGRAGGVVDANLAVAADRAEPAVREAASDAGARLRQAGDDLQSNDTPPAAETQTAPAR